MCTGWKVEEEVEGLRSKLGSGCWFMERDWRVDVSSATMAEGPDIVSGELGMVGRGWREGKGLRYVS